MKREGDDGEVIAIYQQDQTFCCFKPALFFQEVKSWQAIDSALEIKMDMASGKNFAQFPGSELSEERLLISKANALKVVSESEPRSLADAAILSRRLFDASTWGDSESIEHILRTSYVTEAVAYPAFLEAARRGFADCVKVFLSADVSPNLTPNTALHEACAFGQEECAMLIIAATTSKSDALPRNKNGDTPLDILRTNEMNGIARRLDAAISAKFG